MAITKRDVVDLLRGSGDAGGADRAERDLPDEFDLARDRGALESFGIDLTELLQKVDGAGIPGLS